MNYSETPSAKNFPGIADKSDKKDEAPDLSGFSFMQRTPWEMTYEDDIYIGYRYYETFDVPVSYEFGYGLSYTNFEYSNLKLSSTSFDGRMTVSVDVTNTGPVAGREVVQVYACAPKIELKKPEKELVAFEKNKFLQLGETKTLSFTLTTKDLSSFDESSSSWVAEPGTYILKVGASSQKVEQTENFELPTKMTADMVSKALVTEREIER